MGHDKASGPEKIRIGRRALIGRAMGVAATLAASGPIGYAISQASREPESTVMPLLTEFAYEARVSIEPAVEVGPSSHGTRRYVPITGGTFHGPKIQGVVLSGGADWQLERPDGVLEIDARYSMKADDGSVILVRNRGLLVAGGSYFRTVPQFEVPEGPHDWLNKAVFVGSVGGAPRPGAVIVRVFRLL